MTNKNTRSAAQAWSFDNYENNKLEKMAGTFAKKAKPHFFVVVSPFEYRFETNNIIFLTSENSLKANLIYFIAFQCYNNELNYNRHITD